MNPLSSFGPQHWQVLLILEGSLVNAAAVPPDRWRTNPKTNRSRATAMQCQLGWHTKYGTKLADGTLLPEHDDHDCLADLADAGCVTFVESSFQLTERGWLLAGQARRFVSLHRAIDGFVPDAAAPRPMCPLGYGVPDRPVIADGRILEADPEAKGKHIDIEVDGVVFCCAFTAEGEIGGWRIANTVLAARERVTFHELWLGEAREVVAELLVQHVSKRDGKPITTGDVLRCGECKRLLSGSCPNGLTLSRPSGAGVAQIHCGPEHVVQFHDGAEIIVYGDGRLALNSEPPTGEGKS